MTSKHYGAVFGLTSCLIGGTSAHAGNLCNFDHVKQNGDELQLYFGLPYGWEDYNVVRGGKGETISTSTGKIRNTSDSSPNSKELEHLTLHKGDMVNQMILDGGCGGTVVVLNDGTLGFHAKASYAMPGTPRQDLEEFIPVEK